MDILLALAIITFGYISTLAYLAFKTYINTLQKPEIQKEEEAKDDITPMRHIPLDQFVPNLKKKVNVLFKDNNESTRPLNA